MCFYHDYEWTAAVSEETTAPATKPTKCDECRRTIEVGEIVHHIFQQEAEECRVCESGDCACVGDCCQCADPTTGETYDYDRCDECDKFLKAVEAAEVAAGCRVSEARPSLCGMLEEIGQDSHDACRYFKAASRMFPELKASGYLRRIYHRMF